MKPNFGSPVGWRLQLTPWSPAPFTTALNGCCALSATLALGGVTVTEIPFCSAWPEFGSTISGETSTTSKAEPVIVVRVCRSVLFQFGSGAPERNHAEPLSAIIIPYFFSARRIIWLVAENPEMSKLAFKRKRTPMGG